MKSIEFAKEYVSKQGFKLLDDSDEHIAFRYQMNVIHLWGNEEEENFFFMTLPNFTDVTPENMSHVKELCHKINMQMKQVKLYILNDVILAAAELYFMEQEDFYFQMKIALQHLVSAKVMYGKLDK